MSMKAIKDLYTITPLLASTAVAATTTSSTLDFANITENAIIIQPGVRTDGTTTPSLQDSPDNITFTAVPAANIVGSLAALASNVQQKVSYIGAARYLQVVLTSTGATTGVVVGVTAVVKPRKQPAP